MGCTHIHSPSQDHKILSSLPPISASKYTYSLGIKMSRHKVSVLVTSSIKLSKVFPYTLYIPPLFITQYRILLIHPRELRWLNFLSIMKIIYLFSCPFTKENIESIVEHMTPSDRYNQLFHVPASLKSFKESVKLSAMVAKNKSKAQVRNRI